MADTSLRESMQGHERAEAIRTAAREHWARDPAGAIVVPRGEIGSPESFVLIERYRYQEQPWMHETFRFERFAGRRVLEIGVGLGTDHLQFARAGAEMTGIDLVPRCISLTRRRLELEGLASDLRVMDAERLEFSAETFDVVYSFGVLHHVSSAERAFAEVRRVLSPGGMFIGALYNRWSLFAASMIALRIGRGEWRHESLADRLSRVEHSSGSEDDPKPYVRLFGASELRDALHTVGFREVRLVKRHSGIRFNRVHIGPRLDATLGRHGGWYLVYRAW